MRREGSAIYKTYSPTIRQTKFHQIPPFNPTLIKLAVGGLGGGKSTACLQEQALVCLKTPGGKSVALRQTITRSQMSLIEDYQKILQGVARWVASKKRFEFPNDHTLTIVPAEEWDWYGSTEFVSFYIQEAQEVDFRIFDTLVSRLRNAAGVVNGIPFFRGYLCARGVKREHWLYKEFVQKAWNADDAPEIRGKVSNPDYAWLKFTTYDNEATLNRIAPGYIATQVSAHKDNTAWLKMMIEGEFGFDIEGRAVFECYRPDLHDAEIKEDPSLPMLRGWDFGYNRPAVVWCQYTREGRLLVLREFCPTGISLRQVCEAVQANQHNWFPGRHEASYRDYGDIAGDDVNTTGPEQIELVESFFSTSVETRKARINVGLDVLRNLMTKLTRTSKNARFAVDYSCERLRDALGGAYYYKVEKTDERPVKGLGYDDIMDALRYVAQQVVEESFEREASLSRLDSSSHFASY